MIGRVGDAGYARGATITTHDNEPLREVRAGFRPARRRLADHPVCRHETSMPVRTWTTNESCLQFKRSATVGAETERGGVDTGSPPRRHWNGPDRVCAEVGRLSGLCPSRRPEEGALAPTGIPAEGADQRPRSTSCAWIASCFNSGGTSEPEVVGHNLSLME
ncbi:MAG: hypothetical protein QG597_2378 [Actinomycetota bacterium]|nr:hypothetical protein [Actinomycetota bacterium]